MDIEIEISYEYYGHTFYKKLNGLYEMDKFIAEKTKEGCYNFKKVYLQNSRL